MKNKTPAVLWYYQDFESGTMLMTMEEKGIYITLLDLQNIKGHFSEEDIQRLLPNYYTAKGPKKALAKVLEKFAEDRIGKYFNKRMEEEIKRRVKFSESRSSNARGGKASDKHMHKHMKNTSKAYAQHMETETETEIYNNKLTKDRDTVTTRAREKILDSLDEETLI